jgi:hypothetical protein
MEIFKCKGLLRFIAWMMTCTTMPLIFMAREKLIHNLNTI